MTETAFGGDCPALLGLSSMKARIRITAESVECPVMDCGHRVVRQRGIFRSHPDFRCPKHGICISPSTFEYPSEALNILDRRASEMMLLGQVKGAKRESRMARERSEDAVTWNVFRFMERSGLLPSWLRGLTWRHHAVQDVIYWSYSTAQDSQWQPLNDARTAFGEQVRHGSEPDMIVLTDRALVFVEAKLDAGNDTSGKGKTLQKRLGFTNKTRGYDAGGGIRTAFRLEGAPSRHPPRIEWMELDSLPDSFGHGVQFVAGTLPGATRVTLAFIDGFDWHHGSSDRAVVLVRRPDDRYGQSLLHAVREGVRRIINSDKFDEPELAAGFSMHVNG